MHITMHKLTEKIRENMEESPDKGKSDSVVLYHGNETEVVTYDSVDPVNSKGNLPNTNTDSSVKTYNRKNSYRRWFVLGAGCSTYALTGGFISNLSILYVEWLDEFGKSNSETAVVQSVYTGTFYIAGIAAGLTITKYGPQKCGILGGFIAVLGLVASHFAADIISLAVFLGFSGLGLCLAYVSAATSVEMHFNGRLKIMALAFIVFGSGVGMSLFPLLIQKLLLEYGWRGTILIVGGMMCNLVLNSSLFKAPMMKDIELTVSDTESLLQISNKTCEDNIHNSYQHIPNVNKSQQTSCGRLNYNPMPVKNTKQTKYIIKELARDKLFIIFTIAMGTAGTALNVVKLFMIDNYMSNGISHSNSINIYLYMNIASTVSRILPGLIKQINHVSVLFLPILSTLLGSISTACFPLTGESYLINVIAACCYGVGYGIYYTALPVTTAKLVHQDMYSLAVGLQMATIGVFSFVAGPIAGYIRDITGNYDISFYSTAIVIFLSCVSFFIIMVYRHYITNSKS